MSRAWAASSRNRVNWGFGFTLALSILFLDPGGSVAQQVRSRSNEPVSEFLRPPGEDRRYDEPDPSGLPPWQQATFFGLRAQGRVFVFVVDCSGSMADAARLVRAKSELRRCILALRWPQRFHVIFYNDRPWPQPGGWPVAADHQGKSRLLRWLQGIEAEGGTDPRGAMKQAIGLQPDAIFLLSDGEFPEGTVEAITTANRNRIPIHTVDLAGGAAGDDLQRIAGASGGRYAARP